MLRYFPLDKNYILKEAQSDSTDELLLRMVNKVKETYCRLHNPLGLIDNTIEKIQSYQPEDLSHLKPFYLAVAGVYRFKFATDNQLFLNFDGRSHYEIYLQEWADGLDFMIESLSLKQPVFLKIMLELTVFNDGTKNHELLTYRLNNLLKENFEVQIRKKRGAQAYKIA
ncbi:hypothetical protein OO013_11435 [Mangrovivirga sp. M17]|uniref:Uncharacterized protein n=1 Tax=Mangrovivirga halotolerans TaxID=2993936 RepID=A0ABT3RRR6_9BACT|nr:hypothetical protein [Mangrovivirga halotolerans]MCX2744482.1 hypothetical protein [Mangrovivirga halotolerans]